MSSLRSDESDSSPTTRVGVFSDNNINLFYVSGNYHWALGIKNVCLV